MTREEAITNLNMISVAFVEPITKEQRKLIDDTFEMAIKALEQEPKTGHWIEKEHYFERCWARCSICGKTASGHSKDTGSGFVRSYTDYCPNCGARMESEDKE